MTLEKTMQYLYDKYPMLFRTREDCLNHLFCVVGNGFEWVNGELVEISDIIYDKRTILFGKNKEIKLKDGNFAKQTILDKRYDEFRKKHEFKWHLLFDKSGYSHIYDYPKDIKPDWLDGINETKKLLGI